MEMAILYIGASQSLFAAFFSFFKKPLSHADKILGGWLITISLLFMLNIVKKNAQVSEDLWPISVNISMALPSFMYLYSKYITKAYEKFDLKDIFHFTPSFVGLFIVAIYYSPEIVSISTLANYYDKLFVLRQVIGWLFILCLWIYSIGAIKRIYQYKKQIGNVYSFESPGINLAWLQIVVVSYFILYHFIIVISGYEIDVAHIDDVEIFRSGTLLVFVYILSFGGMRQQQLISEDYSINLNQTTEILKSNVNQYVRSKLKDDQVEEYLKRLINHMNTYEAWKDNELSIAKLSEQAGIPRHYITQVLNQNLQKNFNTFVNEYRIEYAKKLITSKKYSNWSFIAVAFESGFNSKATFNSFFKKYTGKTPTEYKNKFAVD